MTEIKALFVDFNTQLDKPFTSVQIDSHADGLAEADPKLLQRALHRAYDNAHLYYQGKPSVAQLKGLMSDIWQEQEDKRRAAEADDAHDKLEVMRDAAHTNEHREVAKKCLSLLADFMDKRINQGEFETGVKEAME